MDTLLSARENTAVNHATYYDHVKMLCGAFPHLREVLEFLRPYEFTSPNCTGRRPTTSVNVGLFDFSPHRILVEKSLSDIPSVLRECRIAPSDSLKYRAIIVEDLSSSLMDALGWLFMCSPSMFGDHLEFLGDLENVGGDRYEVTPPSPGTTLEDTHLSIGFKRFVHHDDEEPLQKRKRNVWRDISPHHPGLISGTVCEERVTIDFRKDVSGCLLAVILVDAFPYVTTYEDGTYKSWPRNTIRWHTPQLSLLAGQDLAAKHTFRDRLVNEALQPMASMMMSSSGATTQLCFACSILRIVISEWSVVLKVDSSGLTEIEKQYFVKSHGPWSSQLNVAHTNILNDILATARNAREHINLLSRTLQDFKSKDFCRLGGCDGCTLRTYVIKDLEYLLSQARRVQEQNDEHLRILTSIMSIDESQKANHANKSLR